MRTRNRMTKISIPKAVAYVMLMAMATTSIGLTSRRDSKGETAQVALSAPKDDDEARVGLPAGPSLAPDEVERLQDLIDHPELKIERMRGAVPEHVPKPPPPPSAAEAKDSKRSADEALADAQAEAAAAGPDGKDAANETVVSATEELESASVDLESAQAAEDGNLTDTPRVPPAAVHYGSTKPKSEDLIAGVASVMDNATIRGLPNFKINTSGDKNNTAIDVASNGIVTLAIACGGACSASSVSKADQDAFNSAFVCKGLAVVESCAEEYNITWADGARAAQSQSQLRFETHGHGGPTEYDDDDATDTDTAATAEGAAATGGIVITATPSTAAGEMPADLADKLDDMSSALEDDVEASEAAAVPDEAVTDLEDAVHQAKVAEVPDEVLAALEEDLNDAHAAAAFEHAMATEDGHAATSAANESTAEMLAVEADIEFCKEHDDKECVEELTKDLKKLAAAHGVFAEDEAEKDEGEDGSNDAYDAGSYGSYGSDDLESPVEPDTRPEMEEGEEDEAQEGTEGEH